MRRILAIYPTLLRVGLASALAYRAEFAIWMLSTTLPFINLALWSAVARDAPVGRWEQADFVAYFLATYIVRLLTGCWVVWELTMEVRQGTLALRLLRPLHPLVAHSAENLAAMPIRAVLAAPVALLALWATGTERLASDPVLWALVPLLIAGAWVMTFLAMAIVGSISLFADSAFRVWEVWLGFYTVLGGYLVPLELFPEWVTRAAYWLPWRLMLGLPVETILGRVTREVALEGLALQLAWITVLVLGLRAMWNAGLRRYAAFGG